MDLTDNKLGDGENNMPVWTVTQGNSTDGKENDLTNSLGSGQSKKDTGLQRNIGYISATSMIVGTMIGSGIFVSPGGLLEKTGSVWLSLIVWVSCGVLSTLGAMAYIELGSVVPSSGAEYSYLLSAFGSLPAFLFSWLCTVVIRPTGIAILCLSLAQYCVAPFVDNIDELEWAVNLISGASILLVTFINCMSVKLSLRIMNYFTLAKLIAMAIIIGSGIYNISLGKTEHLKFTLEGSRWNFGDLASGFYNGLWAYEGWNQLNFITEEVKNPHKNMPRAILSGVFLVIICYFLTNISYLTLLTPQEIQGSSSVAIIYGDRILGVMSFLMPLSVAMSTFGSLNGSLFTTGRLSYVAGREGHLVDCLSYVDIKRNTPSLSLVFNGMLTFFYAVALDIEGLLDIFSFTQWIFYGAAMACLIRLRTTMPDAPRPFKVPIVIPWFVLIISAFLVVAPVAENPKFEYLYAIGFILLGVLLYIPFVHYKWVLPGMGKFTIVLQKLFLAVPPSAKNDEFLK